MANATYEAGLQAQLDNGTLDPKSATGKRVRRVLSCNNVNRKNRALARMEAHSRVHMGISADKPVNWTAGTIDWPSILKMLMTLLPLILALFGI